MNFIHCSKIYKYLLCNKYTQNYTLKSVWVPWGCHNKASLTAGLKTEKCPIADPEAGSLESRCA